MNPVFFGKKYCILWMDWYVEQKVHSQGTTGTEKSVALEEAIEGYLEEDGRLYWLLCGGDLRHIRKGGR